MKLFLLALVTLTLIASSQCGFLDTVLGTVTDTTKSITHGVGNVVHRGKNFVFGGTEQNAAGQVVIRPGIVGTISHKIHDVSASIREEVRTVMHLFDGDQAHRKGIIGRLFDRVKCRVFKIKSFFFGNGPIEHTPNGHAQIGIRPHSPLRPLQNDTKPLCQKLRKYFFNKESSATSGIRQTINSLHEVINTIRFNMTRKRQESGNDNNEQDGSGLIDVRASVNDLGGGFHNDFEPGVEAVYDKVNEGIDEGLQNPLSSFNRAQHDTNEFIENQRRNVQNHYNQFNVNTDKFRSDVSQSVNSNIDSQRKNVQNQFDAMATNADRFRGDVLQSVTDNVENQRRNVQNHYNQFANNADRLRSDVSQSVSDNIENQRRNVQNSYNQFANTADGFRSDISQYATDNVENPRRNLQNSYNRYANNADRFRSNVSQSVSDNIENPTRNLQNNYNQFNNNAEQLRSDVNQYVTDNIENRRRNMQNHYNQFANNADRFRGDVLQSVTDNIENQRRNTQNHYNQFGHDADRVRSDVGSSLSDVSVRVADDSSKVKDLMENSYSKVELVSQDLGIGY